jgi:phosphoribosylanthranilate isomerase
LAKYGHNTINLVFNQKSPRAVNIEQAQIIIQSLLTCLTVISFFVNAEPNVIDKI